VVQNLKIAEGSVFIFSKLFVRYSSGENISSVQRFSPEEYQTKSFDKMNTLLSAIFNENATRRSIKQY